MRTTNFTACLIFCWLSILRLPAQELPAPPEQSLLPKIAELFRQRCLACHGADKAEGGYRLDTLSRLRAAGDSASVPIVPGKPQESELWRRLVSDDEDQRMPAQGPALAPDELQWIRRWIDAGAAVEPELAEQPLARLAALGLKKSATPSTYASSLPVTAVALQPVNDRAPRLWTSGYGEILLWQLEDSSPARLVGRQNVGGVHVRKLAFSHDGLLLAVASGIPGSQGLVEVFVVNETELRLIWNHAHADLPADIAFAPHQPRLAIGQSDGSLVLVHWPLEHSSDPTKYSHPTIRTITPHADGLDCLGWSANGERLITGSRDRTAKIFRMPELELIANYDRHERAVGGVAYLDNYPVSLDETGRLRLWSGDDNDRTVAETDTRVRFLAPIDSGAGQLWLPAGGDLLSYAVERKTVDDGKDDQGQPKTKSVTRWKSESSYRTSANSWLLCLTHRDQWLAGGSESGDVYVWKLGSDQPQYRFHASPQLAPPQLAPPQ